MAVVNVTPAEGPSFGIAPFIAFICISFSSSLFISILNVLWFDLTYPTATDALSFITSPSEPVIIIFPLPL